MAFNPQRFLDTSSSPPDPRDFIFGFGRRICPGKLLADSSVWLTVAKSLAALDISKPISSKAHVEQPPQFTPGIISHPCSFDAKVGPRSPEHAELIRAVEHRHPWAESSADALRTIEIDEKELRESF